MAPLAQNVRKDPQIAPWFNNNTEFEGGRQNMMDFSCMKAVYEHTPYLCMAEKNITIVPHIQVYHPQERRQAS